MQGPPHSLRGATLTVALSVFATAAHADMLYVSDKLVLNVYAEAAQGSARVATIETGDAVEEVERADNMVHVRLADGRDGWVGANYLSSQSPAVVRLKQLESAGSAATPTPDKALTEQLARLQKQNTTLTAELAALKAKPAAIMSSTSAPAVAPAEPAPKIVSSAQPIEAAKPGTESSASNLWWIAILAVLAGAAGGFAAGYHTLARRVRARFGGVKVY